MLAKFLTIPGADHVMNQESESQCALIASQVLEVDNPNKLENLLKFLKVIYNPLIA